MPLLWNDNLALGIKIIDDQHKQFVSVLSEVLDSMGKVKSKDEIDKIFLGLERYSTIHFETEEKYFKEFNYIGAEEHVLEHVNFKKKIAELKQRYKNDTIISSFNLADFLEDWLLAHVNGMDKKYVKCFHDHGLS